jgi:hypothetical protein
MTSTLENEKAGLQPAFSGKREARDWRVNRRTDCFEP